MSFGPSIVSGRRVALRGLRDPVCDALRTWVRRSLEMAGGEVDYQNEEVLLWISPIDGIDYHARIYVPLSTSGPDAGKPDSRFPEVELSAPMSSGRYPIEYYGGQLLQMLCDYIGEHLQR